MPLVCAGGVGDERAFVARARAWATRACSSARGSSPRPSAGPATTTSRRSCGARRADIVLTERHLRGAGGRDRHADYVRRSGPKAGPIARSMLRGRKTKHWMRTIYALRSLWQLKRGLLPTRRSATTGRPARASAGIDRGRARGRDRPALRRGVAGVPRGLSRVTSLRRVDSRRATRRFRRCPDARLECQEPPQLDPGA